MANLIHDIAVTVKSEFLEDQSEPEDLKFMFSYTITISNQGNSPAKLLERHWVITDADGNVQEVHGTGVVGEQPHIQPGESFSYTSGAILPTPVGSMHGTYQMLADDGTAFEASISPFSLRIPDLVH